MEPAPGIQGSGSATGPKTPLRARLHATSQKLRQWLIASDDTEGDPEGAKGNPTLLGHLTISASLVVMGLVLYWGVFFTITGLSSQWSICQGQPEGPKREEERQRQQQELLDRQANIGSRISRLPSSGVALPITPGQTERLKDQVRQLDQGRRLACTVGVFFYAHRNAALSLSTAAGILAISSLALISKQGWKKSNNGIINIGITSGLVLYTAWTFSQLFGQASNYESYSRKYSLAHDLIATIDSAVANGSAVIATAQDQKTLNLANRQDMATLISYVDDKLRIINRPEFTGDASFAEESFQKIGGFLKPGEPARPKAVEPKAAE